MSGYNVNKIYAWGKCFDRAYLIYFLLTTYKCIKIHKIKANKIKILK